MISCLCRRAVLGFALLSSSLSATGQFEKVELPKFSDDPKARMEFELLKTQDPATGKIPGNIRALELIYAQRKMSGFVFPLAAGDLQSAWIHRGPNNVGGRTRALAVDVDDNNRYLAGGVSGGMFLSTTQGSNWLKTGGINGLQSVTCIAQDLSTGNHDTWYYGTGEFQGNSASGEGAFYHGDGIYKSTDKGLSWSLLPATSSGDIHLFDNDFDINHEIVVDPTNGHVLVANAGGIYKSEDGGSSFTNVLPSTGGIWSDIVVTSNGTCYAYIEGEGIFRSLISGIWVNISDVALLPVAEGDRMRLAIAPSNEDILYVLGEDSDAGQHAHKLWRYDNDPPTGEDRWEDRSAFLPALGGETGDFQSQGGYDLLIEVAPDDEDFVVIGGRNLWRSTDGFSSNANTSWIGGYTPQNNSFALYTNHHPDQHALWFLSSTEVLSGSDGGVHKTSDVTDIVLDGGANGGTVDWTSLNNGYLTTQVYALSAGPGDQLMAGFQDNGTWITNAAGFSNWSEAFSGDGSYSAWNEDGTIRYVSAQNGQVFRLSYSDADDLTSNGATEISPQGYNSSLFIAPFYLDPNDEELLYLGGDNQLYVNTQASFSNTTFGWKSIALPGATGNVSELGATGNGTVYVGTSTGQVYLVSDPGGSSPQVTEITGSNFPTSAYVSGIGINPFRPNEALLSFSNYSVLSVFHTVDNGATWTDVSGDLEENLDGTGSGPSVRVARILGDGDRYFVGTSTGLYSTANLNGQSTVWTQEDAAGFSGIGGVVVEHLVTRASDGLVVAGTHGNGIYSAEFEVSGGLMDDLAITDIPTPLGGLLTSDELVSATVTNKGLNEQTSFTLSLFVDDILIVEDDITTSLTANQSLSHTFSVSIDLSEPGEYDIRVAHDLVDENDFNDQLSEEVESLELISAFPYSESFEAADHGWTSEGLWELGEPTGEVLSEASDGTRAWVTDLDGNYPSSTTASLISPVFDFTDIIEPGISFDINYSLETGFDGVVLAFRTDLEDDFTTVPSSSGGANWYTEDTGAFDDTPAWTGISGGYVKAMGELKSLAGEGVVQLAFIFASDEFLISEGFALDNILLEDEYIPNIVPSFVPGPDIELDANSGFQNIAGWASEISDGNDENQALIFELTTNNDDLFSTLPELSLNGDLTFTPTLNTIGTADVTVTLTDDGGTPTDDTDDLSFSEEFDITVNPVVSVPTIEEKRELRLYPNPTKDRVTLDFVGLEVGSRVVLHNLSGINLLERTIPSTSGSVSFDLRDLPGGIYFLSIGSAGDQNLVRIVKN